MKNFFTILLVFGLAQIGFGQNEMQENLKKLYNVNKNLTEEIVRDFIESNINRLSELKLEYCPSLTVQSKPNTNKTCLVHNSKTNKDSTLYYFEYSFINKKKMNKSKNYTFIVDFNKFEILVQDMKKPSIKYPLEKWDK